MDSVAQAALNAREASRRIAVLSTAAKNRVLTDLADAIGDERELIMRANAKDMAASRAAGLSEAKLRRLELSAQGLGQMQAGLRQIAELPDPVGAVTRDRTVPGGLRVTRVRAPIGVIAMIYESRPNVTVDAFSLCFKAGNACLLKGGREAAESNAALAGLARRVLSANGVPEAAITSIVTSDREQIRNLLSLDAYIDLVIPRGGEALIRFVHEHSRIPTVQHFHGVCHVYVDRAADLEQALDICATAKTSAPATCNAAEAVLVHQGIAEQFVPRLTERLLSDGVEVRGDATVCRVAPQVVAATDDDWGKEFLDLIMAVKVVEGLDTAIAHINAFGSNHTDAIVTADEDRAKRFTDEVQSSCTLVNASTRFNDGFQLGLGAEIGISTSKIHAYGPMGLEELTTQRYVVYGRGHCR